MTGPRYIDDPGAARPAARLDAGRLWIGGIATAVVAALVAVVGVLISRGLFDIPLLAPTGEGALGDGTVSDMVWARPAITILGIDCPPVVGSAAAIQPHARARLNLRVPPGMDPIKAQDMLVAHLEAAAPWGVRVAVEREASGAPFQQNYAATREADGRRR